MKFLVNEMPNFSDECPFAKEYWDSNTDRWVYDCSITNWRCNLYIEEKECYGLIEIKENTK